MSLITIGNPAGTADDCSGAALQFRYASPDSASNLLTGTDFLKLIRFIRLWQKLAPLLGDADDAVTIEQTDDILGALYPAADQPADPGSIANDPANRPLLDAGFATLLPRAGFLFQVLDSLSLTADAGLDQLLACWAPIGTAGPNSLYRSMFLTPTLLQQDPGAQTATVASTVNAGDVLSTSISDSSAPPVVITYQVQPGDTAATAAAAIAADINASTAPDPVSTLPPATELPLNSRFRATAAPGSGSSRSRPDSPWHAQPRQGPARPTRQPRARRCPGARRWPARWPPATRPDHDQRRAGQLPGQRGRQRRHGQRPASRRRSTPRPSRIRTRGCR